MDATHQRPPPRAGQAAIEFIVALVSIVVVAAALFQLVTIARVQIETLADARSEAGDLALQSTGSPNNPDYIQHWDAGPDDRTYSRDDDFTRANEGQFRSLIPDRAAGAPSDWPVMNRLSPNRVADLHDGQSPNRVFGLVSSRLVENVPLLPAVQHLLYDASSIEIESRVWMTETGNFY